jgi:hypothetical protein
VLARDPVVMGADGSNFSRVLRVFAKLCVAVRARDEDDEDEPWLLTDAARAKMRGALAALQAAVPATRLAEMMADFTDAEREAIRAEAAATAAAAAASSSS